MVLRVESTSTALILGVSVQIYQVVQVGDGRALACCVW